MEAYDVERSECLVLGASVTGKSHLAEDPPIPCQDSYVIKSLDRGWGIAVVSDGVGSEKMSHIGSKFVSEKTAELLQQVVENHMLKEQDEPYIPTTWEWRRISVSLLFHVYTQIEALAQEHDYLLSELACTLIAVVYFPGGALICHIGDGRAGFRSKSDGLWKPMMIPINGEYSNQVMPITGDFWRYPEYVDKYLNSSVILEEMDAFVVMSDGCESFAYETLQKNKESGNISDVNRPFQGFFDPWVDYVRKQGFSKYNEMQREWIELLESDTGRIGRESDDKTLILGTYL